jgi:phosphohistidine phosphatase
MQLMIMRHGEAEASFQNDAARNLTTRGFIEAQKAGVWLRDTVEQIDMALVSPYVRAQQTFDMVSSVVDVSRSETNHQIVPSGTPSTVHDYVDAILDMNNDVQSLLLVSHMPLVSYLLDNFCGQFESRLFATSSIALLDYNTSTQRGVVGEIYNPS